MPTQNGFAKCTDRIGGCWQESFDAFSHAWAGRFTCGYWLFGLFSCRKWVSQVAEQFVDSSSR